MRRQGERPELIRWRLCGTSKQGVTIAARPCRFPKAAILLYFHFGLRNAVGEKSNEPCATPYYRRNRNGAGSVSDLIWPSPNLTAGVGGSAGGIKARTVSLPKRLMIERPSLGFFFPFSSGKSFR